MRPYLFIWLALTGASSSSIIITTSQQNLITAEDYPRAALLGEMEGLVRYNLDLNPDGTVRKCKILKSSGFELLDDTTCAILTRRAMFPPLEKAERGAAYSSGGAILWRLPGQTFRSTDFVVEFDQGSNGQISRCVEKEQLAKFEQPHRCDDLLRQTEGQLRTRKAPVHVRMRTIVEVHAPASDRPAGDVKSSAGG